jgi:hypothetical protein
MHRSSHTLKSKKIQICASNIHHHQPVSKTCLEFRLRCVPYSTKYYRFILCYIARSGGLLLFVSILTSIAQLQSNKFEQRVLESILTDSYSFKTTTSSLPSVLLKTNPLWSLKTSGFPIPHTYFTKHGSHNFISFIRFLHCASKIILRLRLWFWYTWPSCHGLEHFIHHSTWATSSSAWNCWLLYSSALSCEDSQVNPTWLRFYTASTSYLYMAFLSIYKHD